MRPLTSLQATYLGSIRRSGYQRGASAYDARIYDALTLRECEEWIADQLEQRRPDAASR